MQSIKTAAIDSVNETIQTIRLAQKKHEDLRETTTVTYAYGRRDEVASEITSGDFIPSLRNFFTERIQWSYFRKL